MNKSEAYPKKVLFLVSTGRPLRTGGCPSPSLGWVNRGQQLVSRPESHTFAFLPNFQWTNLDKHENGCVTCLSAEKEKHLYHLVSDPLNRVGDGLSSSAAKPIGLQNKTRTFTLENTFRFEIFPLFSKYWQAVNLTPYSRAKNQGKSP